MSASAEQVELERLVGSRLRLTLHEIFKNAHLRQAETYGPSYQAVYHKFAAQCPLRSESYRILVLPRKDAMAQERRQPTYSITSSASGNNVGGTVRPSAFAVFRLMTKVNLLACSIGRSPGFSPPRIFAAYIPARRKSSSRSAE